MEDESLAAGHDSETEAMAEQNQRPQVVDHDSPNTGSSGTEAGNETLVRDDESLSPVEFADLAATKREESPGLNEYNSAVNYISELIHQLKDSQSPDLTSPSELAEAATLSRTMLIQDLDANGGDDDEAVATSPTLTPAMGLSESGDASAADEVLLATSDDAALEDDEYASESGRAFRRSMLHNLREAAHLVTSASLELNDCEHHAQRAYFCGFFANAAALFSIIFVLMSPRAGTFGFTAALGALVVSCGLGVAYLISYRAFVRKATHVQRAQIATLEGPAPSAS